MFSDPFTTGAPPVVVASGSRLPGVPQNSTFADLVWAPANAAGFSSAIEVQHQGQIFVNERNSDAAPAATLLNARVGFSQRVGSTSLSEFVRINNITDRNYAGSVIVGDTNGRFFEPAPGRNWFAGVTARTVF